jgi:hypothetical protein
VDALDGIIPITLDPQQAYKHAMVPGPWVDEYGLEKATQMAQAAAAEFTKSMLAKAQESFANAAKQKDPDVRYINISVGLKIFGMAIHPIMDAQSPAHKGWQVYRLTGDVGLDVALAYVHYRTESRQPTRAEMKVMRGQILSLLSCVVSQGQYDSWTKPRK